MGKERGTVVAAGEVAPLLCLEWKEDRDGGLQPVTSRSRGGGSRSRPWKMTPAGKSFVWDSCPHAWFVPVRSCVRQHGIPISPPLMLPEPLFKSNYWNCSVPCLFTTEVTCHSGFQLSSPPPVKPRFRTQKRRQIKQQTVYCPQWR